MKPAPRHQRRSIDPDPYVNLPELYDLEHRGFSDDIPLYLHLAEAVGDPILDVGCGTGRVLLPLANAGWRVTGLDRSAAMLTRARLAVAQENRPEAVDFVQADFSNMGAHRPGTYGLVIISLNGLMHLSTPTAQRACLAAAHAALDPRGQLVLDVINPTPETLQGFNGGVTHEGRWETESGQTVDKFSSRSVSFAAQTIDTNLWYDTVDADGLFRRMTSGFTLRYVTQPELHLMLELAGFVDCQFYGSYDLDPYDDAADRLIVTAEVTPSVKNNDVVIA